MCIQSFSVICIYCFIAVILFENRTWLKQPGYKFTYSTCVHDWYYMFIPNIPPLLNHILFIL